jgi:hypothetical protein
LPAAVQVRPQDGRLVCEVRVLLVVTKAREWGGERRLCQIGLDDVRELLGIDAEHRFSDQEVVGQFERMEVHW